MTFVVALAAICDSKLLCAQRSYPEKLRGKWELPGGKVREGEEPVAALVREIKEELDWEIPPAGLKQILPGPLPSGNWPLLKGVQNAGNDLPSPRATCPASRGFAPKFTVEPGRKK